MEGQTLLLAELLVTRDRVLRDSQNHGVLGLEVGQRRLERARLGSAARGHVLGIEVEDDFRAGEVGEPGVAAGGRRQVEIGGPIAGRESGHGGSSGYGFERARGTKVPYLERVNRTSALSISALRDRSTAIVSPAAAPLGVL